MSEYQYYEFVTVDKPLTDTQRAQLRAISTRARITATSFVNDYQWGDLKADPAELVQRYFDAHLYLANWGTRRLMFRLPARLVDLDILGEYCVGEGASAWTHGHHLILELIRQDPDGEDDFLDDTGEGLLSAIIPARAEWAAGDARLLYLAWLCCLQAASVDDDEPEPPVPPGLGQLSAPLAAVADFLRIDTDIIAAAATASAPLDGASDDHAALRRWVTALAAKDKDAILTRLVDRDPHLHTDLLRRFHAHQRPRQIRHAHPTRTAGDLLDAAQALRGQRERRAAAAQAEERERAERATAAARERRLVALSADTTAGWRQVDALIAAKKPGGYDQAVALLADLKTIDERAGRADEFDTRLGRLLGDHSRRPALIQRLNHAGLYPA